MDESEITIINEKKQVNTENVHTLLETFMPLFQAFRDIMCSTDNWASETEIPAVEGMEWKEASDMETVFQNILKMCDEVKQGKMMLLIRAPYGLQENKKDMTRVKLRLEIECVQ